MARIKKQPTIQPGDRIEVNQNGLKWGGLEIPMGTQGTLYIHENKFGNRRRAVEWDGIGRVQPNGFYFGIGGDSTKTFLPQWADKVKGGGA